MFPPTFRYSVPEGAVLLHSRNPKKVALSPFDMITGEKTFALVPRDPEKLLTEFLLQILQSSDFSAFVERRLSGSVNKFLNWTALAGWEFALPPLDEQGRIVSLLSASGGCVHAYESSAERAEVLLEALIHDVVDQFGTERETVKLGEIVHPDSPIVYGILKPGPNLPEGVPYARVDSYPKGVVLVDKLHKTSTAIDTEYERSRLREGDLLISIRGTIGRIATVPPELDGGNVSRDSARIRVRDGYDPSFVRHILSSSRVQQRIRRRITGLAVQGINLGELRKIELPAPPLEEQLRLSQRFATVARLADRLRMARAHAHETEVSLREELLGGVR